MGLGSDGWLWVLGAAEVLALGFVYVGGSLPIGSWLADTSSEGTLFASCLGLAMLAWWCVIGAAAALTPLRIGSRSVSGSPGAPVAASGPPGPPGGPDDGQGDGRTSSAHVDANGRAVLHPGP